MELLKRFTPTTLNDMYIYQALQQLERGEFEDFDLRPVKDCKSSKPV